MSQANLCPGEGELRKLVSGDASAEEQAALAAHLDGCRDCQAVLDRLAAEAVSWGETTRGLDRPSPEAEPALAQAMHRLEAEGERTETRAEPRDANERKLDFLDLPAEPGHLGRLGHYEVLEVVGEGGMGIVLKAYDTKLQRVVAIKVMMPELAARAQARQRFIREARAAAAVTHEHVVTIHAVQEDHAPPYLVMQYIGGRSLQQRIDQTGALEVKEILRIGMQAASGLGAAHLQGLVHRDIKPANILLENGVERVKITDFGLARAVDDARLTQSGIVTGTPQYMSPEQAGGKAVDHRADLFSLGGVMYAMCTGYAPFRASSSMAVLKKVCDEAPRPIRDLNAEIPEWLAAIVEKLMAKEPDERFQSAEEVARLLGEHLAHLQQPAMFPRPAETKRPVDSRPAAAPAKRSAALMLAVFLIATPVLLIPAVAGVMFLRGPGMFFAISVSIVLAGLLLLFMLAAPRAGARRPAAAVEAGAAAPVKRRTPSWVIALVVLLAVTCVCPVPVLLGLGALGLLGSWALFGGASPDGGQHSASFDRAASMPTPSGENSADRTGMTSQIPPSGPLMGQGPPKGRVFELLSWFPADATVFGAIDFTTFGSLTIDSPLVRTLLERLAPPAERRLFAADTLGDARLDGISFALVENPQKPGETRFYLRLSGRINRTRLTRALLEQYPGATARDGAGIEEEGVTIVTIPGIAPLIAIDRDEDVLLAGFLTDPGDSTRRRQLLSDSLRLRLDPNGVDRSRPNLTRSSYANELNNLSLDTFAAVMGDLPLSLRKSLSKESGGPLQVVPRYATIIGTRQQRRPPQLQLICRMPSVADATAFAREITALENQWLAQLQGPPADARRPLQEQDIKTLAWALQLTRPSTNGASVVLNAELTDDLSTSLLKLVQFIDPPRGHDGAPGIARRLKQFDPKVDRPVQAESSGLRVSVEGDALRIDASNKPNEGGAIKLFELPNQQVADATVVARFRMKTDKVVSANFRLVVGGQAAEGSSHRVTGTTDWNDYAVRYHQRGSAPANVTILVDVRGSGTVWVKGVDLQTNWAATDARPAAPAPRSSETLLKKFDPKADKPIARESLDRKVSEGDGGWRIDRAATVNTEADLRTSTPVPLFEVHRPDIEGRRVTLRALVRTDGKATDFKACFGLQPDVGGGRPRSTENHFGPTRSGTTNWAPYEISWECPAGVRPDDLTINCFLVFEGAVWIKDIELVVAPRSTALLAPAAPKLLATDWPRYRRSHLSKPDRAGRGGPLLAYSPAPSMGRHVPDADGAVGAAGGEARAVRAEGHGSRAGKVAAKPVLFATGLGVPQDDGFVVAGRREPPSVRAERHGTG